MQLSTCRQELFGEERWSALRDLDPLHHGKILAMILAGGRGGRLHPLTQQRAKPAVPFGGICRLIDFVLSNMINSGISQMCVLTQHKAHSLMQHLQQGWSADWPNGPFVMMAAPRIPGTGYRGTADAVYQNVDVVRRAQPDLVAVFGADHVYCMDVGQMIQYHLEKAAEVTVATIPMPVSQCLQFGVASVDDGWRIRRFEEKVPDPTRIPGRPDQALVSMGNYIFNADVLLEELEQDAHDNESRHDFGGDMLPRLCGSRRVYAYDFRRNGIPGSERPTDYWRDVGTVETYYHACMDLINPFSHLDISNAKWPLRSAGYHGLPARVLGGVYGRAGCVENSLLGNSSVVAGGYVRESVIGQNVRILEGAVVEESVILGDVVIEEGVRVHKAIIDQGNVIRAGQRIGYDQDEDASRYYVDKSGVVVLPYASL